MATAQHSMENEVTPPGSPGAPVNFIPPDAEAGGPQAGIALCLSGGGYRAMVFHLGALIRLNEAGLLPKLKRVSSVSGGSITAALLGLRWNQLDWSPRGVAKRLDSEIVGPMPLNENLPQPVIDLPASAGEPDRSRPGELFDSQATVTSPDSGASFTEQPEPRRLRNHGHAERK